MQRKKYFLFDIIFILQHHSLLCNNIIPTQSQFSLPKQLISNTTKYFFYVHLYCIKFGESSFSSLIFGFSLPVTLPHMLHPSTPPTSTTTPHTTHSSKPSHPHIPPPPIIAHVSNHISLMIKLPFTMPSPGKVSHHSPAPCKLPFFSSLLQQQ